jgi:hypothetical protein
MLNASSHVKTIEVEGKSDAELIEQFAAYGQALAGRGFSKTNLYEILRDQVSSTDHSEKLRKTSIRDISVLLGLLRGSDIKELKKQYGSPHATKKKALIAGERKVRKVLDISIRKVPLLYNQPITDDLQLRWVNLCQEALSCLER